MADFPYLPMWTDAYLADTTHLRTEEHGAYLLLMFAAWRSPECALPDDDEILSRLAGLSLAKWKGMKATVLAFWKLDKRRKMWVQKRLKKERKKSVEKRRVSRDSAVSRWKKTNSGNANAMRTQCYPEPEPYKEPNGSFKRASARKKSGFVKPRNAADAAVSFIEELNYEQGREIENREGTGGNVQLLPAVGYRRA